MLASPTTEPGAASRMQCSAGRASAQAPVPRLGFEWLHARSRFIFSAGFAVCDSFISCPWKIPPDENVGILLGTTFCRTTLSFCVEM